MRWTFRVTNSADSARLLTFESTQQADVYLRSHEGGRGYRWSDGRMFAPVLIERELGAGEVWSFSLEDELRVEPGLYDMTAILMADNSPPPARKALVVQR